MAHDGVFIPRMRDHGPREGSVDAPDGFFSTLPGGAKKDSTNSPFPVPIPCSLFRVACSLFRVPCSLFHVPCWLLPVPYSLFLCPLPPTIPANHIRDLPTIHPGTSEQ